MPNAITSPPLLDFVTIHNYLPLAFGKKLEASRGLAGMEAIIVGWKDSNIQKDTKLTGSHTWSQMERGSERERKSFVSSPVGETNKKMVSYSFTYGTHSNILFARHGKQRGAHTLTSVDVQSKQKFFSHSFSNRRINYPIKGRVWTEYEINLSPTRIFLHTRNPGGRHWGPTRLMCFCTLPKPRALLNIHITHVGKTKNKKNSFFFLFFSL